tara:strand:+ start:1280 stop:1480 length:201 start_codon:yes stop_codon:yes gene_type:complete
MKGIALFIFFIGTILIIQGYYNNISACPKAKTIIKYVPRSFYEEQLSPEQKLSTFYKGMFEDTQPR